MPGELWRDVVQIGLESTYGTAVAATRKVYGNEVSWEGGDEGRPKSFAVGNRQSVRQVKLGPQNPAASVQMDMSADELLEWFQCGIQAAVAPTTPDAVNAPTARLWTYVPSATIDSMTMQRNDGAIDQRMPGVMVDSYTFAGSANDPHTVTMALMGAALEDAALTGGLTDRVPTYMEGWQTNFYLDAFGGTPGTTLISDALINWNIVIANGLQRKRFARNNRALSRLNTSPIDITATITLEASAAQVATEKTNRLAETGRVARLEFLGPAGELGTGAFARRFVTIDLPGKWGVVNLNAEEGGSRVYEFTYHPMYDPTNAFMARIRANNARTATFA